MTNHAFAYWGRVPLLDERHPRSGNRNGKIGVRQAVLSWENMASPLHCLRTAVELVGRIQNRRGSPQAVPREIESGSELRHFKTKNPPGLAYPRRVLVLANW